MRCSLSRFALLSLTTLGAVAFSGCAAGLHSDSVTGPSAAATGLSGAAHGGQQPVSGSVISLMAPGQTGYGSTPTVLATAITNASGGFTLPAYTCPAGASMVYITATGGNSGSGVNALIGEAAVLGPCASLSASTFINITEVTTIAAAYALAPFATVSATGTSIGTSATNLLGLANAYGPASNIAPFATGTAPAANALPGMILPTAYVNTLANIIASCVNSSGLLTGACGTLFNNTTVASVPPTDTFQAALNIALHPGANVTALYDLAAPALVYAPALSSAPADFSLAIGYNGGRLTQYGALSVAIDATGNAWISTGSAVVPSLTEISPSGVYYSGVANSPSSGFTASSLTNPIGIALDPSGNVLVANNQPYRVIKFNSAGAYSSAFTASSLNFPNGLAVDANGNSWIANFGGSSATEILAAGTEASTSPYNLAVPGSVDAAAGPLAIWETSYSTAGYIDRIDLSTFAVTYVGIGGSTAGVAIDHSNNAWVAVTGNGSIFKVSNSGSVLNPYGGWVQGAGSQNICIDGLGNAFAGVSLGSTVQGAIVELSNSGVTLSSGTGYTGAGLIPNLPQAVHGIAADGSGNIWVVGTNQSSTNPAYYVAEVLGVAAPIVTPLSLAAKNNTLGTRP